MSLTEAEHVFAGAHETALNDILTAVFTARRRYLNYGSAPFVGSTTANETLISTIPFPGISGGIPWAVSFRIPRIDLHPTAGGLPPPLALQSGQFSLQTTATLTLLCGARQRESHGERPDWSGKPLRVELKLWAIGHLIVRNFGGGNGDISFAIDAVEIVDIAPDDLESLLECLIRMLLDAAVRQVQLPFSVLRAGAFSLALLRGPEIEDDQIKLYGKT